MNTRGHSAFVFLPGILVLAVLWTDVIPWMHTRISFGLPLLAWSIVSTTIWMLTLWWSLHHLTFQIASLWAKKTPLPKFSGVLRTRFAVFYVTRDDFSEDCLRACADQDYPPDQFTVVVCDDSEEAAWMAQIDRVCAGLPRSLLVRRANRTGFKAGNLNNAFKEIQGVRFDWIVIVDADEMLPPDYLHTLAGVVAGVPREAAFVQCGREPMESWTNSTSGPGSLGATPFQISMQCDVRLFFERDMYFRREGGFFPFLGHGGAIRAATWQQVAGWESFADATASLPVPRDAAVGIPDSDLGYADRHSGRPALVLGVCDLRCRHAVCRMDLSQMSFLAAKVLANTKGSRSVSHFGSSHGCNLPAWNDDAWPRSGLDLAVQSFPGGGRTGASPVSPLAVRA